jgi:hypothetical protein
VYIPKHHGWYGVKIDDDAELVTENYSQVIDLVNSNIDRHNVTVTHIEYSIDRSKMYRGKVFFAPRIYRID